MKQLPMGHDIVQRHVGSDHLEASFVESHEKNAHATSQDTDGEMKNNMGGALQNMAASNGANCGKQKTF